MKRSAIRALLGGAALLALGILALAVFVPRRYAVPAWTPLPGTRYLTRPDGSRIAWQMLEPDSPARRGTLIFLQGGPGGYISERTLEMLRPFAKAGHRVLAYDQAGSGSSTRLPDIEGYTVSRHLDDLRALLAGAGGGGRCLSVSPGALFSRHCIRPNTRIM